MQTSFVKWSKPAFLPELDSNIYSFDLTGSSQHQIFIINNNSNNYCYLLSLVSMENLLGIELTINDEHE